MEISTRSAGSTRLYALQLHVRPLREGTLMSFSGELVHGAFVHWLKTTTPESISAVPNLSLSIKNTCANESKKSKSTSCNGSMAQDRALLVLGIVRYPIRLRATSAASRRERGILMLCHVWSCKKTPGPGSVHIGDF